MTLFSHALANKIDGLPIRKDRYPVLIRQIIRTGESVSTVGSAVEMADQPCACRARAPSISKVNTFFDTPVKRFTAWGEFSTCFT
jgi:hypothetical protein